MHFISVGGRLCVHTATNSSICVQTSEVPQVLFISVGEHPCDRFQRLRSQDSGDAVGAALHGVGRPCVLALTNFSVHIRRQWSRSSAVALHRRACGYQAPRVRWAS